MKVFLIQDVPKLGKKGDIVKASDGYARNFLIPKKLAVEAKEGEMKQHENEQKIKELKKDNLRKKSEGILNDIKNKKIIIKANAGENGKLFGAVTSMDIVKCINEELKQNFDKKWFVDKINIKELGKHKIKIKLPQGIKGEITVEIVNS